MINKIYYPKYLKYKGKYHAAKRRNMYGGDAIVKDEILYTDLDGKTQTCQDMQIPIESSIKISFIPEKYDTIGESHFVTVTDEQYVANYINTPNWQNFVVDLPIARTNTQTEHIGDKLAIVITGIATRQLSLCDLYTTMHAAFYALLREKTVIYGVGQINVDRRTRIQIDF